MTIEVDESRRVTAVADVPLVAEQFEAEIDLNSVTAPTVAELERELADARQRRDRLRESVDRAGSNRARELLVRLDEERMLDTASGEVRAARTDKADAAAAEQRIRDVQAELDDVEREVRLPGVLAELDEAIESCQELVGRLGDADDRAELADIERRVEQVRRDHDTAAAEYLLDRAALLNVMLLRRDGTFDVALFYFFQENRSRLSEPARANALIKEGERAVATENWAALPGINQRLRNLWPPELPEPTASDVQRLADAGRS
jgi:molecular chaperone DnaK